MKKKKLFLILSVFVISFTATMALTFTSASGLTVVECPDSGSGTCSFHLDGHDYDISNSGEPKVSAGFPAN